MNEDSMRIDDAKLTAVNEQIEKQRAKLIDDQLERTEQYIRQIIRLTDWSETAVIDIIETRHYEPNVDDESSRTRMNLSPPSFRLHGYEHVSVAPHSREYYTAGDHHKRVYRITEQLCREIGVDSETGCDVGPPVDL